MPKAEPSAGGSPSRCWEMGRGPHNEKQANLSPSLSAASLFPVFFLPVKVGVKHSNKYMPTIYFLLSKRRVFL